MSAIWGFISNRKVSEIQEKEKILRSGYDKCVIDRTESYAGSFCAMGCGIQYFTKESEFESLPIVDENNGIYFTADVMLDNREELLEKLNVDDKNMPDGRILFEMFHKYKESCLNEFLGVYAFVYYNQRANECYLVSDSTGTRSLHYYVKDNEIYFSTLIEPIAKASGYKELNEQWICDFLALDNMALSLGYENTPYKGINRMEAAHYIKITEGNIEKKCYWNPTTKDIKGKKDKEYKELFKQTYRQAVKRVMRNQNMTMLLSGGLDSTSVACLAAEEAAKTGKTITSYTSIPEKGFNSNLSSYYVTDESEAVKKTQKFLEQRGTPIKCKFMDLEGINSWDGRKDELDVLEIPYKSMQNLLWIKEGMKNSYNIGARVMLTGGYGNITISNSFTSVYQHDLIKKFKWIKFIKDSLGYKKKLKMNNKTMLKTTWKILMDVIKPDKNINYDEIFANTLLNSKYMDKHNIKERYEADMKKYQEASNSPSKAKELMKNEKVFYQIGETQTKHSLATGVIQRDPTMDKRLIELCMQLPVELYSQKGVQRRLVREYLADEMPEHVINAHNYGLQSADTAQRLKKNGDRVFGEIEQIFKNCNTANYVNEAKALEMLDKMKAFDAPNKNFNILRLEYTAMVLEYIQDRFLNNYTK